MASRAEVIRRSKRISTNIRTVGSTHWSAAHRPGMCRQPGALNVEDFGDVALHVSCRQGRRLGQHILWRSNSPSAVRSFCSTPSGASSGFPHCRPRGVGTSARSWSIFRQPVGALYCRCKLRRKRRTLNAAVIRSTSASSSTSISITASKVCAFMCQQIRPAHPLGPRSGESRQR